MDPAEELSIFERGQDERSKSSQRPGTWTAIPSKPFRPSVGMLGWLQSY